MKNLLIVICLVLFVGCKDILNPVKDVRTFRVEYRVSGSGTSSASLTYNNSDDNTSQISNANLTWSYKFNATNKEFFAYISAQNNSNGGSITSQIIIDGKVCSSSTSSGGYVIATASGRLENLSP